MIIPLAEVNWGNVWMETGIGIAIVFVILTLIIFILSLFNVFAKTKKSGNASVPKVQATAAVVAPATSASEVEKAAIATALYLYYQNVHDVESGVITIKHNDFSAWHHELNPHL